MVDTQGSSPNAIKPGKTGVHIISDNARHRGYGFTLIN
jgi:hypothetical protein